MSEPLPSPGDNADELSRWADWPTCPACGTRRQARCATCGFASDSFPLAEYQELGVEADPVRLGRNPDSADRLASRVLLMCPVCDEAFRARFYDRCAACGHDFGYGVRIEAADDDPLSPRMIGTIAALVVGVLAILAYLSIVMQR